MNTARVLLSRNKFAFNYFRGKAGIATQVKLTEKDVEEVRIPMPWGHIAGKWWGNKNEPPMIGLHGWQDNANSFDPIVPMLNVSSFLAIDAPGHGLSSHYPPGKIYNFIEYLLVLRRIVKHFNWEKFSIFGHSLGGALGYAYSAIYPDEIKCLINFDCARSLILMYTLELAQNSADGINKILKIEKQLAKNPAPVYKLSDLVKIYSGGSMGSITPESALIILQRGAVPVDNAGKINQNVSNRETDLKDYVNMEKKRSLSSIPSEKKDAINKANTRTLENITKNLEKIKNLKLDVKDDKMYVFTRDPRIKVNVFGIFNEEYLTEFAKNIKCPVLSMRGTEGFLYGSSEDVYLATNEIIKKNCYFEQHDVKGSHHGHLNNPENVAPVVNNFLKNINYWKWWGPKDRRPILCLHGWQDNAGTFDTLIPILPDKYSYLAVDFPGHGFSSRFNPGLPYSNYDLFATIRRIQNHYSWKKISFIAHSLGSIYSYMYSCIYPDEVDFYIGIDSMKPMSVNPTKKIQSAPATIEQFFRNDALPEETAPAYEEKALIERWCKDTNNSVTEESVKILMKRGTVKTKEGLYKLLRDPRLKGELLFGSTQIDNLQLVENIKCNMLIIKATNSTYFEKKEKFYEILDLVKSKAKYFEYHKLQGTHHLHLNTPEIVAPVIISFLEKVDP